VMGTRLLLRIRCKIKELRRRHFWILASTGCRVGKVYSLRMQCVVGIDHLFQEKMILIRAMISQRLCFSNYASTIVKLPQDPASASCKNALFILRVLSLWMLFYSLLNSLKIPKSRNARMLLLEGHLHFTSLYIITSHPTFLAGN
jgi:hypothetical protein